MKLSNFTAAAALALVAGSASSAPVYNSLGVAGNQSWGGLMANVFSVGAGATNLQVTQLGAFDSGAAGFSANSSIVVALLNITTSQNVASTTFSFGDAKSAGSDFAFKSVAPVILAAGNDYAIVAAGFDSIDQNYNSYGGVSAIAFDSLGGALTQKPWYFNASPAIAFSGSSGADGITRFGAGTLVVNAVPEPGTYALLLAGLAAMGFAAKRRKA